MIRNKEVHIVGGPNGAGKTTFVKQFLPEYTNVTNFVNADDIALGLSPFDRNAMPIKSGKLMLELIDQYREKGESFGFETTLAGKKWQIMIKEMKKAGYLVYIFFLDLSSVDLAVARVRYRVESGGHEIPEETIRRRYLRSRHNFWYNYKDLADNWYLINNSRKTPELIANRIAGQRKIISSKYFDFYLDSLKEK